MVKIAVIGWYGTETIGDRAILAGLIRVMSEAYGDIHIHLGSLYPVVSEHTLIDDTDFFIRCAFSGKASFSLFCSSRTEDLKCAINNSDLLIVGGGPLMDISQMYMLHYSFAYAANKKVKIAICGCGWGPLKDKKYIQLALDIAKWSDLVIFRDKTSLELYNSYTKTHKNIFDYIDPAAFALDFYLTTKRHNNDSNMICVNYREIMDDMQGVYDKDIENKLVHLTKNIADQFKEATVCLVPMHTFSIGGDDRVVLNRICKTINAPNVFVQNNPLTLEETMDKYFEASFCVGMRFHSILFQMMLNGRNYILDYTDMNNGKTINLLHQLHATDFYANRYISLQRKDDISFTFDKKSQLFMYNKSMINQMYASYVTHLRELLEK